MDVIIHVKQKETGSWVQTRVREVTTYFLQESSRSPPKLCDSPGAEGEPEEPGRKKGHRCQVVTGTGKAMTVALVVWLMGKKIDLLQGLELRK